MTTLSIFLGSIVGFTCFLGLVSLLMAWSFYIERKRWENCILQPSFCALNA